MAEPSPGSSRDAVGILTEDAALYRELSGGLRSRDVPVVSLLRGEKVPRGVAVVVTSVREAGAVDFPSVVKARHGRWEETWVILQVALRARPEEVDVTVGVDPGPRPGLAVVLDGKRCVASGILDRPEEVAAVGLHIRETFPRWGRMRFRVGNGDHVHQCRIVNALLPLGMPVEVVDERGTTPHGMRNNDPVSAMAIALTRGERVRGQMAHAITERELRNLQRLSRERTGGRLTIPRDLAAEVLKGRMSLTGAIAMAKGARQGPPPRG